MHTPINYRLFKPKMIKFTPKTSNSKKKFVGADFLCLDTETSKKKYADGTYQSWIYQWCFDYPDGNGDYYLVYGRTVRELVETLDRVKKANYCSDERQLVIYIHNMSYDYCFFKDFIEELYGKKGKILAVKPHKLISYEIGGLVFKDSLKLANMSLDKWGKSLGIKHRKKSGLIDYNVVRFPDTPLYKNDWEYQFADIVSLRECLETDMKVRGYKVNNVPLTSTGYVRETARKNFKKDKKERDHFRETAMTVGYYKMLKGEFAGGYTHGNRNYRSQTVQGTIRHRDFRSHYPSQIICKDFPCSKFAEVYNMKNAQKRNKRLWDFSDIEKVMQDFEVLAELDIKSAQLHDYVTAPYMQVSKCISLDKNGKIISDNGRVLKLKGTYRIVANTHDLKWLFKQYDMEYDVVSVHRAERGKAPKYLIDTTNKYYVGKSLKKNELKDMQKRGVSERSADYILTKTEEMIEKGGLNGIYGMTATDVCRSEYGEDDNGEWYCNKVLTDAEIEKELEKYYKGSKNFMEYHIGCWVTSHARDELFSFIEEVGYENFLYADTDSIFYLSNDALEEKLERINNTMERDALSNGHYVTLPDGIKVTYHSFEAEKENITAFKFLHAKCYAYVTDNKDVHCTIAGVAERGRRGTFRVDELARTAKNPKNPLSVLDELNNGKVFKDCGGTGCYYGNQRPTTITVDGHTVDVASCCVIFDTDKTLKDIFDDDNIAWQVADSL